MDSGNITGENGIRRYPPTIEEQIERLKDKIDELEGQLAADREKNRPKRKAVISVSTGVSPTNCNAQKYSITVMEEFQGTKKPVVISNIDEFELELLWGHEVIKTGFIDAWGACDTKSKKSEKEGSR